jgi:hypothetical protein
MHYHNVLISLFKPLIGITPPAMDVFTVETKPMPQEILELSKVRLETLIRLYYARHGFEYWDTLLLHFLTLQGFNSLEDLARLNDQADRATRKAILSTIILCAKGLHEQGRNYYLAEATFRMMREHMGPRDSTTLLRFTPSRGEEQGMALVAKNIMSDWPINIVSVADNPEDRRMDTLMRAYSGL